MLPCILFLLWLVSLIFLYRQRLQFFYFVLGSTGLFCFLMYLGWNAVEQHLAFAVTCCMDLIAKATGLFVAYPDYAMITTYYNKEAISFFVDYECSGFIETLVYLCLLFFYPMYKFYMKAVLALAGSAYILMSNIIRLFIICFIVKKFGPNLFFFSHTVFARVVFFFLTVALFYHVFTKPHVLMQKVGGNTNGAQ